MDNKNYEIPEYGSDGFTCPNCEAYAHQVWWEVVEQKNRYHFILNNGLRTRRDVYKASGVEIPDSPPANFDSPLSDNVIAFSECKKCTKATFRINKNIIYPPISITPPPHDDMPEQVKEVYNEAKAIAHLSPRASAALLRLALEKLLPLVGAEGDNINNMIGDLVSKGLNETVAQALDGLRVIGNESVHPGVIDIQEDKEIPLALFRILNFIVEKMITDIKVVEGIYDLIPENKKDGIKSRNVGYSKKRESNK